MTRELTASELDRSRPEREIAQCRHRMRKPRRLNQSDRIGALIGFLDWLSEAHLQEAEAQNASVAGAQ